MNGRMISFAGMNENALKNILDPRIWRVQLKAGGSGASICVSICEIISAYENKVRIIC